MKTLKSCLLLSGLLVGSLHSLSAKEQQNVSPTTSNSGKVESLEFSNVKQLHIYNIAAFEQVRDAFGFSRVIKIYQNPMHQQNLIVGNTKVKSISLVSNALSKSLNVNTLELRKPPKSFRYPTRSHPSFQVSFASAEEQEKIYNQLSPKKPMIQDGTKVWAAMFAKQQCLNCHETYKRGSVIGAFVYELEGMESPPKELPDELTEEEPKVLREVTLNLSPMPR